MVKISNASFENEIHRVDSLFNEDSKNITFLAREAQIRAGTAEIFREMAEYRETYFIQIREWSILIENTGLYSLISRSFHYFGFPAC